MRNLLSIALLLLSFAYGGIAHQSRDLPQGEEDLWYTHIPYRNHSGGSGEWKPIRIGVNMGGVLDTLYACDAIGGNGPQKESEEDYPYLEKKICEKAYNVEVTDALEFFKKNVREAVKLHADRLLVKPVGDKLKVKGSGRHFDRGSCKNVVVPPEDEMAGVPNADVVLYLDLTASHESVTEVCKYDNHGRPIAASIKLNPQDLKNGRGERKHIRLLAHEISHAIGFDTILHKSAMAASTDDLGDSLMPYEYRDEKMLRKLREVFNCEDDVGAIKMQGTTGGATLVHFRNGVVKGELMNPIEARHGSHEMEYSALSLAVFESTGHFKAVFENAEGDDEWKKKQQKVCKRSE